MIWRFLWLTLYSPNQSLPSRDAACSLLFWLLSLYWLLRPPRAPCQVIDGERQVKNRKWHAHSCTADKMAEPIAEPSFLDPLWADLSTDSGSQFTVQFRRGMERARWQKKRHHMWGQCSLFDGDIRTLAYREACHPCKTDLHSKNYSGWISQAQQSLWQEGFITADHHKQAIFRESLAEQVLSWGDSRLYINCDILSFFPLLSLIRLSQIHVFQILQYRTVSYCHCPWHTQLRNVLNDINSLHILSHLPWHFWVGSWFFEPISGRSSD